MRTAPNGWAALFSAAHKTEYKFEIATGSGSGSSGAETEYDPETGDLTLLFDSEYDEETGNLTILSEAEYASGNLSISGGGSSTGSTAYTARHIKSVPTITKPLMDQLSIGRCATGSLSLQIYDRPGITIPRAAEVKAYCRLTSVNGSNSTDWVQIGHYYVSNRSTKGNINTLLCHDDMMKGGAPYLDHTSFIEWPQSMADVVEEIASIMGVDIDSRTVINTGAGYDVDYPDDLLMTEVLGMIAAAHGGNWIITDIGELRLVPLVTPEDGESIGTAYKSATMLALTETISRVTLTDNADNVYTAGDDTGTEITAACNYATQAIVNALGASGGSLAGVTLKPYALSGAYINPLLEPGDTVATTVNGTSTELYVASMSIKCTIGYTADLGLGATTDDEDEYPYKTARDLAAERYISMGQSYFGNRINRREGFVSEFTVNDVPVARLLANANVLSMQQLVGGEWKDRIYFDPVAGKYQISTDVIEQPYAVEITASEPLFVMAADSDSYTPASITLTANVEDTDGVTFQWQKDGTPISGATNQTLVVTADSITGKSAVYGCTVTHDGQTSYDQTVLVKLADGRNGSNGSNGAPGTNGSDGWNTVQIYLYKRGDSAEVDWTNSLTYTFATNAIGPSIPNGWSRTIPDADGPVWVTVATASSRTASDTIAYTEWSSPVKLAQDGADGQNGLNGQNGQNGANGINTATIYLYLRSSQAVETPTGGQVYTFATHTLNELPGDWTETIPENDGSPLWVTVATAASNTATDTIDGWSTPEILAENGANGSRGAQGEQGIPGVPGTNGYNTATIYLYQRNTQSPAVNFGSVTYRFSDRTFTSGSTGNWKSDLGQATGTDPLWVIAVTVSSQSATVSITIDKWTTPVVLAQNGAKGDPGEPGETGPQGADGADGTDGYTIVVENDYVSIETDLEYKTKTSGEAFVIFHVYRGTSELTQINSTTDLSESTFVVSAGTVKITGFSYSVNTSGSRLRNRMSWNAGVSLAPMAQQEWVIRVKDGDTPKTISAYTTIAASVNDVIIQRTADLIQTNTEFSSRLTRAETRFSKPINSATAPTNPTADMLWYDSTNGVLKQYDADEGEWEVVTAENARGSYAMASSLIQQFADSLELSVSTPNAVTYSKPSGVTYGFDLDSDGWYVSTNGGVASSFSYFRVDFNLASSTTVTISCDIGSEPNFDYGYISNLDQSLATNNNTETVANAKVYTGVQIGSYQLTIPAGAHFLTVKYRKDGSGDQNGDRFKFKISGVGGGSRLKLTSGGVELSGADITITGAVTFAEMTSAVNGAVNTLKNELASANGTTVINGNRITTGQISAERIDLTSLKVRTVYAQGSDDIIILTTNGYAIAFGNPNSATHSTNISIWANSIAFACSNRTDSNDALGIYTVPSTSQYIDGAQYDYSHVVIPFFTYGTGASGKFNACDWCLGTIEYPFRNSYQFEYSIADQGRYRNSNYGYFWYEDGILYFTKHDATGGTDYEVRLTEA